MNNEVLTTNVTNGIAVITLGSQKRMYFDQAMGDALAESLERFAGNAAETALGQRLPLERNLFLRLCISDEALARMRSYDAKKIISPTRGFEV